MSQRSIASFFSKSSSLIYKSGKYILRTYMVYRFYVALYRKNKFLPVQGTGWWKRLAESDARTHARTHTHTYATALAQRSENACKMKSSAKSTSSSVIYLASVRCQTFLVYGQRLEKVVQSVQSKYLEQCQVHVEQKIYEEKYLSHFCLCIRN